MGTGEREGDREKIGGFARIFLLSFLSLRHFRCIEWALHWTLDGPNQFIVRIVPYFEIGHRTFWLSNWILSLLSRLWTLPGFSLSLNQNPRDPKFYLDNARWRAVWKTWSGLWTEGKEWEKKVRKKVLLAGRGEKTKVTEKLFNLNAKLYSSLFPSRSLFFSQSNKSWYSLYFNRSPLLF